MDNVTFNLSSKDIIHGNSIEATTRYLTFINDRATVFCFLEHQEIGQDRQYKL